ncbi:zinc finger protein [Methanomicrobium sp. W14]|uniref:ZPR1 zinc finger domain-containing protein n=1 Tax=Methanomicrobium sp. W14 TaxID=2817839 RepID=UPI001AE7D3AB|nr:ZPR1 zinc finger domain-containing protein [Methanomicrobium sp. W14]MBP2134267.1 zinc finger protein [Methanomicrobium sp. W14]
MRRVLVAPCPVCKKDIQYIYETERIPYFQEVMIANATCDCGFCSVETFVLGDGAPVRYTLKVEKTDDLSARVIRSSEGTMEIPELGISVTPGPACEAFISNVEGVLVRFDSALDTLLLNADEENKKKIDALKKRIADAREVKEPFTLIIQDLGGNSGIVSKKTVKSIPIVPEDKKEE